MLRDTSATPEESPQENGHKGHADAWSDLAKMTGYIPESPPGKPKSRTPVSVFEPEVSPLHPELEGTNSSDPEPLLDQEDLQESEEATAKTKTPLWSDPFAKAGFVSLLMAAAVGSVGLFLWSINGNWHSKVKAPAAAPPAKEVAPQANPQQAEISRLKTVAALGTQAQTLQEKGNQVAPISSTPTSSVGAPSKVHLTQPSVPTSPRANYTSPQTVAYTPPRPYAPVIAPPPAPFHSAVSSSALAQPSTDPQEAWQQALTLGSYGQVSTESAEPAFRANPESESSKTQATQQVSDQQSRYEADANAILSGVPSHTFSIVPGTTATASLSTPVIWAQDLEDKQQPQRFGLRLTQPLVSSDGTVALPAGTQMVAQMGTVSGSGMVELEIVAVVAPTERGNKLINVPAGAISIAGEGGMPLMAQSYNPSRDRIAGMDAQIALMGALGQVGSLLNRPQNESTTTSPYLSSTAITNGSANLLGGLLEGGFNTLLKQNQQRQQAQIQEILQRPDVWYVPAEQPVQLFVTSAFQVSL